MPTRAPAQPRPLVMPTIEPMPKSTEKTPSQLIDGRIKELGDWRGEMLAKVRAE